MKDYVKEFDEQVRIASQTDMSDAELLATARTFIKELQDKVAELSKEEKDDLVSITCYNDTKKMKRSEAIKRFEEYILYSEGSERDRYVSVVAGLKAGKKTVDDEWKWSE